MHWEPCKIKGSLNRSWTKIIYIVLSVENNTIAENCVVCYSGADRPRKYLNAAWEPIKNANYVRDDGREF